MTKLTPFYNMFLKNKIILSKTLIIKEEKSNKTARYFKLML